MFIPRKNLKNLLNPLRENRVWLLSGELCDYSVRKMVRCSVGTVKLMASATEGTIMQSPQWMSETDIRESISIYTIYKVVNSEECDRPFTYTDLHTEKLKHLRDAIKTQCHLLEWIGTNVPKQNASVPLVPLYY